MKVCTIVFGVLVACAAALAVEHGHIIDALQPQPQARELVFIEPAQMEAHNRQKRGLLLGASALGLGALGAGALGLGAVGLGAGLVGAKAGFVGGALAGGALSRGYGRSYGGYGYGGSYGGYGGGYGGYGGYSSYPSYYYSSW